MPKPIGIEAMVLAAGGSRRLGTPKALLSFGDRCGLEWILEALRGAGVSKGVVVVGEHAPKLSSACDPSPLVWTRNPVPDTGRMGSVLVGLRALTSGADILLWPVDRPLASAETVAALVAARERADANEGVIVPECRGGLGHPVILRASLLPSLVAAYPDANLREVIRESGLGRRSVSVDDPGIHFDLDTAEEYEKALAWWREARARA